MISITELKVIVAALSVPNHCVKESTQVLPKIPVGSVPENKPLGFSAATRVYVGLRSCFVKDNSARIEGQKRLIQHVFDVLM